MRKAILAAGSTPLDRRGIGHPGCLQRAYRAGFRPHLQIQTERRIPSPIFLAALLGTARLRIVWLTDEIFSAGDADRDRIVRSVIVEHYCDCGGCVSAFGRISGYVLGLLGG